MYKRQPYYQSECGDIYTESYRKLEQRGLVYPCFCSRSQLHACLLYTSRCV